MPFIKDSGAATARGPGLVKGVQPSLLLLLLGVCAHVWLWKPPIGRKGAPNPIIDAQVEMHCKQWYYYSFIH